MTSTISPLADPQREPERYIGLALSATLFAGIISLLLGVLKQGSLVRYVSPQVLAGFVTAAALVIIVSQLKGLFGVQTENAEFAIVQVVNVASELKNTKWVALVNGVGSLAFLFTVKHFGSRLGPIILCLVTTVSAFLASFFGILTLRSIDLPRLEASYPSLGIYHQDLLHLSFLLLGLQI